MIKCLSKKRIKQLFCLKNCSQALAELRHIQLKADQLHILRAKKRTAHSGIALDDSIFTVGMLSLIHICVPAMRAPKGP